MRRLTVLFVLSVVPGCAHYQMWVQPVTVHHDGRVSELTPGLYEYSAAAATWGEADEHAPV